MRMCMCMRMRLRMRMRMLTLPQTGAQHAQLLHGQRGVGARVGSGVRGSVSGVGAVPRAVRTRA